MLTARIALVIWAFVGPMLAAGLMRGREAVMVRASIRATRIEEQSACNDRVAQIALATNSAVDKAVAEAVAAANEAQATPDTPADILALCNKSASCRSRVRPGDCMRA